MRPGTRKALLAVHIAASVGWLGAVGAFLVLAAAAMSQPENAMMRAAYVYMELIGWWVLVPLAMLSLVSGVLQGLGTQWGLVRHYWVLVKLVLTALSTMVLLAYMKTLGFLSEAASDSAEVRAGVLPSLSPVLHASAALLVLLLVFGLSIYKPRGLTGWGRR